MRESDTTRRGFLSALTGAAGAITGRASAGDDMVPGGRADLTIRIAPVQIEIAKGRVIRTIGYNGGAPGPLIRLKEGVTATIDLINDTDAAEFCHWHGFDIPAVVDGAEEEGSPGIPAHGRLRYRLTPAPAGCRFVHTHAMSMGDLNRGAFTGQFAFAHVEPRVNPGGYDQEVFLATHEWEPFFTSGEEEEDLGPQPSRAAPNKKNNNDAHTHGREVEYRYFTINGKCLGHGDPVRVREGQRVLFHFLNGSATESARFALPGHRFEVVALDGNPVPRAQLVDVVELGTAERVDAVVTMDHPGVWVMGTPRDSRRAKGMGIVVEYANRGGSPQWVVPPLSVWDYAMFAENRAIPKPDFVIPLVFGQANVSQSGFEQWTINGRMYDPKDAPALLAKGKRHRLIFDNQTSDVHPVHLHRASFELTRVYGKPAAGVMKDVVLVRSYQTIEADVTPRMDGLYLFHCHQQLHMDFGFKMLFKAV